MDNNTFSEKQMILAVKEIDPVFGDMVELGLNYVPYIGKLLMHVKLNRFERRLKENEEQIERIGRLASSSVLSSEYISERIFPIVLSDLIEEHEDAKINLILTGYENVFINEKNEESLVIHYFDTLRNLRYADIRRFFYLSQLSVEDLPELNEEMLGITRSIDKKLMNLNLIKEGGIRIGQFEGMEYDNTYKTVDLTLFGRNFLDWITIKLR
ncbi:hypothetical protein P4H70_20715 [Paenibacillus ehimensis]|uniref:hypothetical protein n=1 Tax=Paenibacillus ehimensis TaxID=79264 RepID=UPI002DB840E7|nr:hypothetical protein [Paenibacillus ehimensis]MEC0211366.1 hypothetical protein [Paenibacillus ehimensis]